jgi:hypothetical protein
MCAVKAQRKNVDRTSGLQVPGKARRRPPGLAPQLLGDKFRNNNRRKDDWGVRNAIVMLPYLCTACGFWDTELNPTPPRRRVEAAYGGTRLG